jgi:hypothetical protein
VLSLSSFLMGRWFRRLVDNIQEVGAMNLLNWLIPVPGREGKVVEGVGQLLRGVRAGEVELAEKILPYFWLSSGIALYGVRGGCGRCWRGGCEGGACLAAGGGRWGGVGARGLGALRWSEGVDGV